MNPEDVFKGLSPSDWVMSLCRCLLQHQERIERKLGGDGRYAEFGKAIARWRDEHLNGPEQPSPGEALENTARVLFGICGTYGVIEFLVDEGLLRTTRVLTRDVTRGKPPVRTRGTKPTRDPLAGLREEMREIAALYGKPRHGRSGASL